MLLKVDSTLVGYDLTQALGILKWEPSLPASLAGLAKGTFPGFIRKTDQERIQNLPEYFEKYRDLLFEVTIKLDGSSCTAYHRDGELGVCSRNLDLKEDGVNSYWKATRGQFILEALLRLGRNLAVQSELIGEGIQGNPEKLKGQVLWSFDVWDIDKGRYLTRLERTQTFDQLRALGAAICEAPALHDDAPVFQMWPTMPDILNAADGPSLHAASREGLVFKSTTLVNSETVTFKAVSNTYLMKHGDR